MDNDVEIKFNTRKKDLVTSTYKIIILNSEFKKIVERSSKDVQKETVFHASVDDIKYFEKGVNDNEGGEIQLLSRNSRLYKKIIRQNTPLLTWNAKCKKCEVTYKFTIPELPGDKDIYVNVAVQRFKFHEHEEIDEKNKQIRGQEIGEIAKQIKNDGGSAHNFYINELGRGRKAPSEQTLRKIMSEDRNKFLPTTNWIQNLFYIEETYTKTVKATHINGYIRSIVVKPQFAMCLYLQKQLECINKITPNKRIGFADATGGLCRLLKKECPKYNRMLNYFFLMKDIDYIQNEKHTVLLADMASTEHDTYRIGDFFRLFKRDYEKIYRNDPLYFRLIISDYSWAIIHGIIQGLNMETIEDYMIRVYDLSTSKIQINDVKKTWLCSCVAHTMNRFANSIKSNKKIAKKLRSLICFSFALLLNCLNLESMLSIYRAICYVFLSPTENPIYIKCIEAIEKLIRERPKEKEIIQNICDVIFRNNENNDTDIEDTELGSNDKVNNIIDADEDE